MALVSETSQQLCSGKAVRPSKIYVGFLLKCTLGMLLIGFYFLLLFYIFTVLFSHHQLLSARFMFMLIVVRLYVLHC